LSAIAILGNYDGRDVEEPLSALVNSPEADPEVRTAADEALEMASQLIVQHSWLEQQVKQALINFQREIAHGE